MAFQRHFWTLSKFLILESNFFDRNSPYKKFQNSMQNNEVLNYKLKNPRTHRNFERGDPLPQFQKLFSNLKNVVDDFQYLI